MSIDPRSQKARPYTDKSESVQWLHDAFQKSFTDSNADETLTHVNKCHTYFLKLQPHVLGIWLVFFETHELRICVTLWRKCWDGLAHIINVRTNVHRGIEYHITIDCLNMMCFNYSSRVVVIMKRQTPNDSMNLDRPRAPFRYAQDASSKIMILGKA